jgi:capsular exopolysaccharide synthesis family protein
MLLSRPSPTILSEYRAGWPDSSSPEIDVYRLITPLLRRWRSILAFSLASFGICLGALAFVQPLYTATTTLLIDTLTARSLEDGSLQAPVIDSLSVDSQVEVLRSKRVVAQVIEKLDLASRPPFSDAETGIMDAAAAKLSKRFGWSPFGDGSGATDDPEKRMRAIGKLVDKNLDVRRLGRSYVLEVSYTSPDPRLSADIADGIAAGYLRDQLGARQQAAQQASAWLQEGLQEIRKKSVAADLAVQRFRSAGKPVDASSPAQTDESLAQLRELEREADSLRTLRQNLLQRFEQAAQERSFPVAEARVIGPATVPDRPSQPNKIIYLASALLFGASVGAGFAFLGERRQRFLRSGTEVREDLELEYLGALPSLRSGSVFGGTVSDEALMRYVLDHPHSPFADTLQAAGLAAEIALHQERPKVVGVVSLLDGEGTTTTAKNLASLLARQGYRTLLIDGDLRNPELTDAIAPEAREGLMSVLLGSRPFQEVALREESTGLLILPSVRRDRVTHSGDLIASPAMRALLNHLRETFEYVIVDLPSLTSGNDARTASAIFSGFLLVAEWGRTPRSALRASLDANQQLRDSCLGVVLAKVPGKSLEACEPKRAASPRGVGLRFWRTT